MVFNRKKREEKINPPEALYEKYSDVLSNIRTVIKCSFISYQRMRFHASMTQWSTGIIAIFLIIIPVIDISSAFPIDDLRWNIFAISLSIFLLYFTQVVASENHVMRSEKYHSKGLDLNRLYNKYNIFSKEDISIQIYSNMIEEYTAILERYENHTDLDYQSYIWYNFAKKKGIAKSILHGFGKIFYLSILRIGSMVRYLAIFIGAPAVFYIYVL